MHGLIRDAVAQEFFVERQEDMQKLIVNTHYAVEDLIKILWLHQGHWDEYVLRVMPSNLSEGGDRQPPSHGKILIISARWLGDGRLHHEADLFGVEDQRSGSPIAQSLGKGCFSGPEGSVDPDYHVDDL